MNLHIDPSDAGKAHTGPDVATPRYKAWALFLLLLLYMMSFIDRSILNTVGQLVKADLHLTDLELGLLGGLAFAVCNGVFSIPIARLAERFNRVRILVFSLISWSLMTVFSGLANNFWHMFIARVGVGIGHGVISPPFGPHGTRLTVRGEPSSPSRAPLHP